MGDKLPTNGLPRGGSLVELAKSGVVKSAAKKRHEAVALGLDLGFPGEKSSDSGYGTPVAETPMQITIDELHPYELNPRKSAPNPQYHEIRDSIRNSGLHNPLAITRRPGEDFFITEAGGNTRLQILRELWAETRDECFYRISVVFKPWKSESTVLAKHLIENNVRGDMTFWDNANGFMDLKSQLEVESGQSISLRQFEEVLRKQGVVCNKSDLAKFGFAVNYLRHLGAALPHLPSRAVTEIQPRLNLFKRFAEKHSEISEAALYEEVLAPVMTAYGEHFTSASEGGKKAPFDTEELMLLCEDALATRCSVDKKQLQQILDGLRNNPDSPIADLLQKSAGQPEPQKRHPPQKEDGAPSSASTRAATERGGSNAGENNPEVVEILPVEESAGSQSEFQDASEDYRQPEYCPRLFLTDADLLPAILQDVGFFAEQAGIYSALRFSDSLPFGFWVDMVPLDPGADELRHISWWVLCTLSGQLHGEFVLKLPDDATWRSAIENDQQAVDHTLGGLPDFLNFHQIWALDKFPQDVFEAYVRLLGAMRRFKDAAPERFNDAMGGNEA